MRTSGRTALLTKPHLHRTGLGEEKKHIKRGAKGLSLSLSPPPRTLRRSSLRVFGSTCPHASKMDFPALFEIKSSCNTDLSKSYNMVRSRPESYNTVCPRPESCDMPKALTSVTPNLHCDEPEPSSIHSPDNSFLLKPWK